MESISRKSFMRYAVSMGIGAGAGMLPIVPSALATDEADPAHLASNETSGEIDATNLNALGGSAMSLYDLNKKRKALVEASEEFTRSDGTVVPAVYNKLRSLIDTYGVGVGNMDSDESIDLFVSLFSEDEAQAMLQMPYGQMFTAAEFAGTSGRDEQECLEICDNLADRGLLFRAWRSGVPYFHQVPLVAHGVKEYNVARYYEDGYVDYVGGWGVPSSERRLTAGSPQYRAMPVNLDVVGDERILALEDWQKVIDRAEVISLAPCICRMHKARKAGEEVPALGSEELKSYMSTVCGHKMETCLSFGEEAEYYIERGVGRQITKEEARQLLSDNVEAGMIVNGSFTRGTETICSCHGDCCSVMGSYLAVGVDALRDTPLYNNISDYELRWDCDACIGCGACANRCPMGAIEMDEDNHPSVTGVCVRCGQCGTVCPAHARTLWAKPEEERLERGATWLDDENMKAAYRFDTGAIG